MVSVCSARGALYQKKVSSYNETGSWEIFVEDSNEITQSSSAQPTKKSQKKEAQKSRKARSPAIIPFTYK